MLNVRLAEAESLTHDVIRDLVGVKLDITNYAVRTSILEFDKNLMNAIIIAVDIGVIFQPLFFLNMVTQNCAGID